MVSKLETFANGPRKSLKVGLKYCIRKEYSMWHMKKSVIYKLEKMMIIIIWGLQFFHLFEFAK